MHRVLGVFAHPDDETFICGGTLAQFAMRGAFVSLVCATKGEMGRRVGQPPAFTRETIGQVRELELRLACQALGISRISFLGLRDKSLEIHPLYKLQQTLLEIMEAETPDTIVTFHPEWGGHPDHCAIGLASTKAVTEYRRNFPNTKLYYVCSGELIRHPDRYGLAIDELSRFDVTDCLERKLQAFRAHRTQSELNDWLWKDDYIAMSKLWREEYLLNADVLTTKHNNSAIHF